MCGVPYHAAENYIARLIQKGYRVAICDQMEDPSAATKLVRREVTRIVTPGTAMNAQLLRSHENNYLAAVMPRRIGDRAGIAHVDISTGEFRATEIDLADVPAALETLNAREALVPDGRRRLGVSLPCLKTEVDAWVFEPDYAARSLCDHFRLLSLDGCGLEDRIRWPPAPLPRSSTTSATRSAPRSITWSARRSMTAPTRWFSTRPPSAIWNWSSRSSPASRRTRRCSTCSTAPAPAWAAACFAAACSRLRSTWPRSKRVWTRSRNCTARPSCAPSSPSTSNPFSTSSGCWPRSRSPPPARATCSRWRVRWP